MVIRDLVTRDIPSGIIEAWERRWPGGSLLPFQEKAFSDANFWDDHTDLVIQGPTSSGKTFIAEVLAAKTFSQRMNNCIYLVPYRALVSEKYEYFRKILGVAPLDYRVYPSSSDFQDYDGAISKGQFDLAVMVYEKLFAMLSQSTGAIGSCRLIVVDELQMISDSERGGKLELILTRLLSLAKEGRHIRIVGLGGVGSDLTQVIAWLNAYRVTNDERPVPLREGVCTLDGKYKSRLLGSARIDDLPDETVPLSLPLPASQNELVTALARHHIENGHKVLIFRGGRSQTKATAFELERYLPRVKVDDGTRERVNQLEETDVRVHLLQLIQRGIAYHNVGLSFDERDLIESQFSSEDGLIRTVVATETLAMGVNLPADVVILADLRRPSRGRRPNDRLLEPITVENYRNCIGRAGRYKLAKEGRSYILASNAAEAEVLWRTFVLGASTKIDSVLQYASLQSPDDDYKLAPYVLNRIAEQATSERRLTTFFGGSLAYSQPLGRLASFAQPLKESLEKLENLSLVERDGANWQITSIGNAVARSAISVGAYEKIAQLLDEIWKWQPEEFYSGDVLFAICGCPEIERFTKFIIESDEKFHTFQSLWQQPELRVPISPHSRLQTLVFGGRSPGPENAIRLKRALLLGQWMVGHSPKKIHENTRTSDISWGDLRLLGDLAAWMIEAAANVAEMDEKTRRLTKPLRELAEQVKYGVPAKAVYLAKLHVKGLHRGHLMKLLEGLPRGQAWDDYILTSSTLPLPTRVTEALRTTLIEKNTKDTNEGKGVHLARIDRLISTKSVGAEWRSLVFQLYETTGKEFERVVKSALTTAPIGLKCYLPPSDKRAEPDLVIEKGTSSVIGECKRLMSRGKKVSWEEARQVHSANPMGLNVKNRFVIGYDGFHELAIELNGNQPLPALLLPLDTFVEACMWTIEQNRPDALLQFLANERGHFVRWQVATALQRYVE